MGAATKIVGAVEARYHVPKNQCYEGSRGGTKGNVHLHVSPLMSGRLHRDTNDSRALCGKRAWWPREPENFIGGTNEWDAEHRCPRCVELAERHGIAWPPEPERAR